MIEYLEKLKQDREYGKGVAYAESLLARSDNTEHDLVAIYRYLGMFRLYMGEYQGAIAATRAATALALQIEAWDDYGVASLDLGVAYAMQGQLEEAVSCWYDYVSRIHMYAEAAHLEANVRYNLGKYYARMGDYQQACKMLFEALGAAKRWGDSRQAHGVRQALIEAYMELRTFEPIPRLLAQSGTYLRNNKEVPDHSESRLFLFRMRAEFAVLTRRYTRAQLIAVAGLTECQGDARLEYGFHMLLATIAREQGAVAEALGHSLSARAIASRAKRYDLESDAMKFVHQVEVDQVRAREIVDEYYLSDFSL